MQNSAKYLTNCVNWDKNTLSDLQEIIDNSSTVTRDCFMHKVNKSERKRLEVQLGYFLNGRSGLTMARDPHVTYHKSNIRGTDVYYFTHSAIEYIFVMFPGITFADESEHPV